jgi:hypothetical protein
VPVLFGLSVMMFVIARLLPGDPVGLAAGPNATQAEIAAYAAEFGLDQPVWVQYWRYLGDLVQGDLGRSIFTRRPVLDDLIAYLPATLELVFAAMALAVVLRHPGRAGGRGLAQPLAGLCQPGGRAGGDLDAAVLSGAAVAADLRDVAVLAAAGRPLSHHPGPAAPSPGS